MNLIREQQLILQSEKVVVFTGAGMSAESGVPTFRGKDGLWRGRRAEEIATPEFFASSPEEVLEFYRWRRELLKHVELHPGHVALGEWTKKRGSAVSVVTQNVDGLHQKSGCPEVIELHGSIWSEHCQRCQETVEETDAGLCSCGGRFRPSVVWFGESLPEKGWSRATDLMSNADLILVIGTSAVVYPAAGLVSLALKNGAHVLEVNPEPVLEDSAQTICGTAATVLPELLRSPQA
ncbi:MAG: NAD-dependent deacylase [Planctomycetia bacterium]|nr:NAD-dependent deacylase [Planctomycetia bacterium]MBL6913928.1 NAD-dependent deacylase [Planctomycetota bacterium]